MRELYPIFFLVITIFAFFLNLFGLMKLIPLYVTLPLFFISIYITLLSMTNRNTKSYRRLR